MASGSKTARRSTPTVGGKVTPEAKVNDALRAQSARLIPLAGGTQCYFREPLSGKLLHLRTSSDEFTEALRESCGMGLGERVRAELEGFHAAHPGDGWDKTITRLETAGVLELEVVGAAS